MIQATATGNIGKDAEIKTIGDKQYSVFRMGVTGREKLWVQVMIPFREGKLHPYLVKGAKVMVVGSPTFNAYINKDNAPVTDVSIWADRWELQNSIKNN